MGCENLDYVDIDTGARPPFDMSAVIATSEARLTEVQAINFRHASTDRGGGSMNAVKGGIFEEKVVSLLSAVPGMVLVDAHPDNPNETGRDAVFFHRDSATLVITEMKNWGRGETPSVVRPQNMGTLTRDLHEAEIRNLLEKAQCSDQALADQILCAIASGRVSRSIFTGPHCTASQHEGVHHVPFEDLIAS